MYLAAKMTKITFKFIIFLYVNHILQSNYVSVIYKRKYKLQSQIIGIYDCRHYQNYYLQSYF